MKKYFLFLMLNLFILLNIISCSKNSTPTEPTVNNNYYTNYIYVSNNITYSTNIYYYTNIFTNTSGPIEVIFTNTTWNNNRDLDHNVFIDNGAILTISPGVVISFFPDVSLKCYSGSINAIGTTNNRITFTKKYESRTGDFCLSDTSVLKYVNIFSISGLYGGSLTNTIIENSIISNLDSYPYGIKLLNSDYIYNIYYITGVIISNCYIAYNAGATNYTISTNNNDTNSISQYYNSIVYNPRTNRNW